MIGLTIGGLRTVSVLLFALFFQINAGAEEFFSLYSRPNDDRFQNTAGASGEPYEVSRIRVSLDTAEGDDAVKVTFKWSATMTTGRHVEAGAYFDLVEKSSDIPGVQAGRSARLRIVYPKGATAQSSFERKIGSRLEAEIPLGTLRSDGTYRGELQIRNRGVSRQEENTQGITQLTGREGSVFQTARWTIRISDGRIRHAEVECQRFAEPLMRLIESNWTQVDKTRRENQPYSAQPRAAKCKPETVGEESSPLPVTRTEGERLGSELAPLISEAGCLDCHAEGNENNFRFCDDGRPVYPDTDAASIFSLINNPAQTNWERYPDGMKKAVERLTEAEKTTGLVSRWAFKHGVSPGPDFIFRDGIACKFDLRFRNLRGQIFFEAPMSEVPAAATIPEALAASCRTCLSELQDHKKRILGQAEGGVFMTYACVMPRSSCEAVHDGVAYSIDQQGLQKALLLVGDPQAPTLCRTE